MSVLGLVSFKHSPGVTTAAVALGLASDGGPAVVVELDPAGGDVAARAGVALDPGLVALAAAGRNGLARSLTTTFAQALSSGVRVVVAPPDQRQAAAAVEAVAGRLVADLRDDGSTAFIDAGRWSPASPATDALSGCDCVVVIIEPSIAGVEQVRTGLDSLRRELGVSVFVVLVGERPYRLHQVAEAIDAPVIGALAVDPAGVTAAYRGPARLARRCALVRSARSLLDAIERVSPTPAGARR